MDRIEPSEKTTECTFKGHAHHYGIEADDRTIDNAAWRYAKPYEEHETLRERIAFHENERSEVELAGAA